MLKKLCLLSFVPLFFILYSLFLSIPAHASWNVDLTPPTCSVNPTGTFQVGIITYLYIRADDNNGINSLSLTVPGVALPPPTCYPNSCACPAGTCITLAKGYYNWTPTVVGSPYTLNVSARDTSGNPCSISPTLSITDEIQPWIQTTGDVHSNTNINTPGGP